MDPKQNFTERRRFIIATNEWFVLKRYLSAFAAPSNPEHPLEFEHLFVHPNLFNYLLPNLKSEQPCISQHTTIRRDVRI
jgi:hypothetical protein